MMLFNSLVIIHCDVTDVISRDAECMFAKKECACFALAFCNLIILSHCSAGVTTSTVTYGDRRGARDYRGRDDNLC